MSEELPEGWAEVPLEQLTSAIQYGYTASAKAGGSGPRMLRITDIQNGKVDWATVPGCVIGPDDLRKYQLTAGDIVFARSGATTGKSFLIRECPRDAVYASYLIRVRARDGLVLPDFLSDYFGTPEYWAYITENLAGNAQPNCNGSKLAALKVPVAPLPEQRRIVAQVEALLEQVNRAKGRLDRVPLILKRFRQAVLVAACSGELTREWRDKSAAPSVKPLLKSLGVEPALAGGDREIPESWAWVPFSSLIENHDGRRVPVKSVDREKRRGKYTYYGASGPIDTIDDFLFDGTFLLIGEDGANLLSRSTPIAFTATGKFWVNNHAHVVRPRAGIVHGFLEAQFNSLDLQDYVTGTAQPKLTQGALNTIPIATPPTDEQEEVLRRVEALFALADTIERRVQAATARADKLPQAILSKAFSGELVPTEAELARAEGRTYETAEELLKRTAESRATASKPAAKKRAARRTA